MLFVLSFGESGCVRVHLQLDNFANERIQNELDNNHYITDSNVLIDYIVTEKEFKTDTIKVGVFLEDNFDNMNACPFINKMRIFPIKP